MIHYEFEDKNRKYGGKNPWKESQQAEQAYVSCQLKQPLTAMSWVRVSQARVSSPGHIADRGRGEGGVC